MNAARAGALAVAAGLASIAASAAAESPCGDFVGPERLVTGRESYALAVADFDLDGLPDIASIQQDAVVVSLSRPEGFERPIVHPAEDVIYAQLAVGDFTGDGKSDVVVANVFSALFLFVGNGDGTLQDAVHIGYAPAGGQLTAADVDGDGALDLVGIAYSGASSLFVLRGHGDGTFDTAVPFPIDGSASSFDLADVDGDGYLDAVVAGTGNQSVVLFLGTDQATFTGPVVLTESTDERAARFSDVNGDGVLDIVTAETIADSSSIDVRFGRGGAVFDPPIRSAAPLLPVAIRPADLDGDGVPDLAVLASHPIISASGGLEVFHGVGDGTFVLLATYVSGGATTTITTSDFDGDGAPDVAVGSLEPGENWVMRGRGDGSIRGVPTIFFGSSFGYLVSGDFTEDGRADLAAIGYDYPSPTQILRVAAGRSDQTFQELAGYSLPRYPIALTTGDFHATGHLDLLLVTTDQSGQSIDILPGHGDGTFGSLEQQPLPIPPSQTYIVAPGRFDSGGFLDLAVAGTTPSTGLGFVTVLLGGPNGTFTPGPTTTLPAPMNIIKPTDLDGDGNLDLVAAANGRLFLLLGQGDGSFAIAKSYLIGTFPTGVAIGDVNGDEKDDILVSDFSSAAVLVLLGLGGADFAPPYGIGVGGIPFSVELADVNADGSLDIVCAVNPQHAALLLNYGDATFVAPKMYAGMNGPLEVADFDGDGLPDAAVCGAASAGVAILWNGRVSSVAISAPAAIVGFRAVLTSETGIAAATYRWRKGGVPLTDGGAISGSQTPTLTIDPVSFADAGDYDLVVTDACGAITSPAAPLFVEFADVPPSSPFHDDIITIATAGITGGCGGGNYCPASPVRRDQMAVFLLKSEHGSSYAPPPCNGVFADVACPSPFADWVEQLATEGVTSGCGGGNYCPAGSVTRAQMAAFLLKTSQGSSYAPPPATGIFGDVSVGSFAADFIEDLYNRGITGGCSASPLLYCPGSSVSRQQMATFLVRTFGL